MIVKSIAFCVITAIVFFVLSFITEWGILNILGMIFIVLAGLVIIGAVFKKFFLDGQGGQSGQGGQGWQGGQSGQGCQGGQSEQSDQSGK